MVKVQLERQEDYQCLRLHHWLLRWCFPRMSVIRFEMSKIYKLDHFYKNFSKVIVGHFNSNFVVYEITETKNKKIWSFLNFLSFLLSCTCRCVTRLHVWVYVQLNVHMDAETHLACTSVLRIWIPGDCQSSKCLNSEVYPQPASKKKVKIDSSFVILHLNLVRSAVL